MPVGLSPLQHSPPNTTISPPKENISEFQENFNWMYLQVPGVLGRDRKEAPMKVLEETAARIVSRCAEDYAVTIFHS